MDIYHESVLLKEVIELLNIQKNAKYIDATLGGGGISFAILEKGGKVLGLDIDREALEFVKHNFKFPISNSQFQIEKGNFKDIFEIANKYGFNETAGIIFDLGVSSHQFDSAQRGFSFKNSGPLDMRMDQELTVQAQDLINILTKGELHELFSKLGEERFSNTIAKSIVSTRKVKPIRTTKDLSEIIDRAVPNIKSKPDIMARIYQALRIAVNDELNNLRSALPQALKLLEANGKIGVISFHSLEDRIVKNQFIQWEDEDLGIILTKKPIRPTNEEIERNKRSRSAKLRVFQKN